MQAGYDIIGDIHGHADKLEELLKKLGYSKKKKEFTHSERKVVFVGDYMGKVLLLWRVV